MSLVDITLPPAEDETMDPVTKQYVDSSLAVKEAQADSKLGEFRAAIEAYTARADEREAAAREREAARSQEFDRRMAEYTEREAIRAKTFAEHEAANREREALAAKAFAEHEAANREREALAAKAFAEREAASREREDIRAKAFEQRMDDFIALSNERHKATLARFDRLEATIAGIKKFIVGASLSTVLGVGAIYAALIQNYHAAFDSARQLTIAERDIAAQRQRTVALLSTIEARLAAMEKTGGQKVSSP